MEKTPPTDAGGVGRSVLARQQDRVAAEIKGDAVRREVGVFNRLGVDDVVVAVLTDQRGGIVWLDRELPHLEFFSGDAFIVRLNDRDFIEEPIGFGLVGDVLGTVGEQHLAVDAVAIPLFGTGELRQVGWIERLSHGRPLSFE